jgi:ATP/maltotriose-dependent transcriptional regulator MalT
MELASDRWTEELAAWESRIWASLQIAVTDYAIGPRVREPLVTLGTLRYETGDLDAGERQLCQVQRMNITGGFV